ncbi:MAG: 2TM domain-containing protein [Cellulomonas sp.]
MSAPNLTQYQSAERALATSEARTAFRTHATIYAVVIPVLAVINLLAVPQFSWFEFPMLG